MRVAAAQIDVRLQDPQANLQKHLDWIQRAKEQSCDLLVFPELSLTGYQVGDQAPALARPLDDPMLTRLAKAAGETFVVFGLIEDSVGAQLHNSAVVVRRGEVQFVHRKLNLANYGAMEEGKLFAAGRYVQSFGLTHDFTGGLLLCSDLWNPALTYLLALHGATLLLAPTNSSIDEMTGDFSKPSRWDLVLKFYAVLYGLPIVFANRIGREGPFEFWGGSRILDAFGNELARAERDEALLVAELHYEDVRRARFQLPTVRDSNLGLIHREIDRLVALLGVPEGVRRA
jgi:predicted amidohydrolase